MKKIFTIIFLLLSISSFGQESDNKKITYSGTNIVINDDTPYIKEIIAINDNQKLKNAISSNKKIGGFVKDVTKEVEKEVLKIDKYSIIYKSYLFTRDGVKIRVLYIDEKPDFQTYQY